jgi:hypothetical protein
VTPWRPTPGGVAQPGQSSGFIKHLDSRKLRKTRVFCISGFPICPSPHLSAVVIGCKLRTVRKVTPEQKQHRSRYQALCGRTSGPQTAPGCLDVAGAARGPRRDGDGQIIPQPPGSGGSSCSSRFPVSSAVPSHSSMPSHRRPSRFAATSVVPGPHNGSTTKAPALLDILTIRSRTATDIRHTCPLRFRNVPATRGTCQVSPAAPNSPAASASWGRRDQTSSGTLPPAFARLSAYTSCRAVALAL